MNTNTSVDNKTDSKVNMMQYIKMIVVLTGIAAVCGFLLSTVKQVTAVRIEEQILVNVKLPAIKTVLESSTNDLLGDRRMITMDEQEYVVFEGKKEGKTWAIAFEGKGTGFGGDIGVMVGFYLEKDILTGIGILTHQETPGLGARISETVFTDNFKNKPITAVFKVKKDNGEVDAVSGASYSSRGVCTAVQQCIAVYPALKKKVMGKAN
ncbi:RnfABCDGE type electron transport complex subunit G [Acidobacteriota bacterium]